MYRINKVLWFSVILVVIFLFNAIALDIKDEVYSKLKCCPCKTPFAQCRCLHAQKMKAYIDGLIDAGVSDKDTIFIKVAKKYSLDSIKDKATHDYVEKKMIEEAGPKRPQIFIEKTFYNLGKVSKSKDEDKKVELVVPIFNRGNIPLVITRLSTSCGCTTVRFKTKRGLSPSFGMSMDEEKKESNWQEKLLPQEKGELLIFLDLNHPHVRVGHILRAIYIESNDPIHPRSSVEFEVEIEE